MKDYTIQDYKLSKLLPLHNLKKYKFIYFILFFLNSSILMKLFFETLKHNKMPYGRNTIF